MDKNAIANAEKVAKVSMVNLLFMALLKGAAGVVTGMSVLIADAVSTFADTLSLFASYMGLKLSRKSADKDFSYGYYKAETFAAFLISLGMMYLGYIIIGNSIETFSTPPEGQLRYFGLIAAAIAIVNTTILAKKLSTVAEKVNSLALKAAAKDKKMDIIASFGILMSIFANYKGIPYVEGTVSIIIAVIILKEGFSSAKESLFFLLDYWDDPKLYKKIQSIFRKEKEIIIEVKKLKLRRAGTFVFGEAFVEVNPFVGMDDLRESLNMLNTQIRESNEYIKDFSIYSHLSKIEKMKIAVPISAGRSMKATVATSLNKTKGFLFVAVRNGKIKNSYTRKVSEKNKKPENLGQFLNKEKINILIDNNLNSLLYFNLKKTHHIMIYPNLTDVKVAEDAVKLLLIDT